MSKISNSLLNLSKSLVVLFFGIFITLVITELGLFVLGQKQIVSRAKQNKITEDDQFIILALGESTTASIKGADGRDYSWPALLEKSLNEDESLNLKFKVVNEGWSGTRSTVILNKIDQNLEKYQPDLVISMIGINDSLSYTEGKNIEGKNDFAEALVLTGADDFKSKFRVYRLAKFLVANLSDKWSRITNDSPESKIDCSSEADCLAKASAFQENEELFLAEKFWLKVLEHNQNNLLALTSLGNFYLGHEEFDKAFIYAQALSEYNGDNPSTLSFLGFAHLAKAENETALNYFLRVLENDPQYSRAYAGIIYSLPPFPDSAERFEKVVSDVEHYEIESAEVYNALINHGPDFGYEKERFYYDCNLELPQKNTYDLLSAARYCVRIGDLQTAEKYYYQVLENPQAHNTALIELFQLYKNEGNLSLKKDELVDFFDFDDVYFDNYRKLHQKLKANDIPLIAVQYPMRSVDLLKLIHQDREKIWFVDNEASFKEVIENEGHDSIFVDQFAGDFGHCNQRGNQLLADNIKLVILDNWDSLNEISTN